MAEEGAELRLIARVIGRLTGGGEEDVGRPGVRRTVLRILLTSRSLMSTTAFPYSNNYSTKVAASTKIVDE